MPPNDDQPPDDEAPGNRTSGIRPPPEGPTRPAGMLDAFFAAREENFRGANDETLQLKLAELEQEHRDLDAAIEALAASQTHDRLAVARLKKKKLKLKDLIQTVKDQLTPDIIA